MPRPGQGGVQEAVHGRGGQNKVRHGCGLDHENLFGGLHSGGAGVRVSYILQFLPDCGNNEEIDTAHDADKGEQVRAAAMEGLRPGSKVP